MKHYAIERWVDFSRHLVAPQERAGMEAHLAAGCEDCRELAGFTGRLTSTCAGISLSQVPESAFRLARAIFPVRAQTRRRPGSRLPVELIFDSFLAPAPAGLRSTWQVGWQGLYRAGDCSLDVRIEPELKSLRASVIGQVTNHVAPSLIMGNCPVDLRRGRQIVAGTVSNRFGEFQMDYEQQPRLKLVVHLPGARSIEVPLRKLTFDPPAARRRIGTRKQ
ncbi:MAG: hypothetical protein JST11_15170 [Acidobacteria bacterium]|nr:hypothetical protein [Acidobacteriota bacterium]